VYESFRLVRDSLAIPLYAKFGPFTLADGRDTRCMSELVILDELMARLSNDHQRRVRPCEYFQSITGVGASGYSRAPLQYHSLFFFRLIAVLLGVLGLPVDEARDAFAQICERVFPSTECTKDARSALLVDALKALLARLQISPDIRLQNNLGINANCHV
jgi:hypothetical protein